MMKQLCLIGATMLPISNGAIDDSLKETHRLLLLEMEEQEQVIPFLEEPIEKEPDEQMAFVFEFVRHGARAPLERKDTDLFSVSRSQLTPEGMRQRYLLGKYNKERYTKHYQFLSEELVPDEVYMQSSAVLRTIQSGYSELMGMYPPGETNGAEKLQDTHVASFAEGKAAPPFKVRDYSKINTDLGHSALPNDFTSEAIFLRMGHDVHDDIRSHGCHYIKRENRDRLRHKEMWLPYMKMKDDTTEPFSKALGYSHKHLHDISFLQYCTHADTIIAADYEGKIDHHHYFTDEQWAFTKSFQRLMLTEIFSKETRALMVSRIMRKPLQLIMDRVNAYTLLGRAGFEMQRAMNKDIKFMIYSGHDTQVDNIVVWLTDDIDSFEFVPFASTVTLELKYSAQCLRRRKSEDCFSVVAMFNGDPLQLKGCTGDKFSDKACKWSEFMSFLQSNWYVGHHSDDLDLACKQGQRSNDWHYDESFEELFALIDG